MKRKLTLILVALIWFSGCVPKDGSLNNSDDPETDEYRQALVSSDDLKMEYAENGTASSALNGNELAFVGLMTRHAVVSTHLILSAHLLSMRILVGRAPNERLANSRIWDVRDGDKRLRLTIKKSDVERGTRYEYKFEGSDGGGELLNLLDGDVVRFTGGGEGFGTVRFYLTNLNTVDPDNHESTGTVRAVFRKVRNVRQVAVRIIDHINPNDLEAPRFAQYGYTLLPDTSGALKWFSVGDAQRDGAPYENVSIHSVWREDHSGIGNAHVFGGSLDVDFWNVSQCWDKKFFLGFQIFETPDVTLTDGELESCFSKPEQLDLPDYVDELPDEDPEMPQAHEAESE